MKCFSCGAELTDGTRFCSYCGVKIEPQAEPEVAAVTVDPPAPKEKKSLGDKGKEKAASLWGKLSLYGKISTIAIAFFALLCLMAFAAGKTLAGIIASVAVALFIVALLMKKQVIKAPKGWLHIVVFALAIVLIVPYVSVFSTDYGDAEKLNWSEIVLGDVVPKPSSLLGDIITNTDDYLIVNIYKTSRADYDSYVEACKGKGFTLDAEESAGFYRAYNSSNFKISLSFNENDSKMHISAEKLKEYGTFEWPENDITGVIPKPTSTNGEIIRDDESGVHVYVSNTSLDDFAAYIAQCKDMGFTVDASETEKTYTAKNSDGNKLSVEYHGNRVVSISVEAPEYAVTVKIEFVENLIFSRYDVNLLVDDSKEAALSHGEDTDCELFLKAGEHTITFAETGSSDVKGSATFNVSGDMEISYKISCHSDKVSVEDLTAKLLEQQQAQAAEEERIAAEAKAEEERLAAEAEAAEKSAALIAVLEAELPQEMAKRAAIVAITNYCTAADVFMPDGNTLDPSKFHSYADTSGNFFDYYNAVSSLGEWSAKDEGTWHVEELSFTNCFGNTKNAVLDVRFDGENYIVSDITITFGDQSDPSRSGISVYDEDLSVSPELVKDDRGYTRLDSYSSWVNDQFSIWDGSHKNLTSLIKKNLNDEKSYDHIETTYSTVYSEETRKELNNAFKAANNPIRVEIGDLVVTTQFSAKNAFNATVKNTAFAVVSFANDTITLVAIE